MKKFLLSFVMVLTALTLFACGEDTSTQDLDTIKVYGPFDTFDPSEDYVSGLIKELTGVDVEYSFMPQDATSADTKLYLDIAGQAEYDLLKLTPNQFNQLRGVNALLDLSDLLEEYGPNILASVDESIWATATFDEGTYAVPQKNPTNNINSALFLRKDLFVKNNIELPETLTEFKEALISLKNAESSSFVPFSASSENILPIRGAFGLASDWIEQSDGSVVFWAETPEFEGYVNYMHELVVAGVMQDGYLTTPGYGSTSRSGLQNGTVAVTLDAWWCGNGIINGIASSLGKTEQEIIDNASTYLYFIPSLKGDSGYPLSTDGVGQAKMDYSITYFYAIPKYMEAHAISVIKWMDTKLEEDNFKQLTIGTEGVTYEVIDDEYYPILTPDEDGNIPFSMMAKADYFLTGTNADAYSEYWQARARKNPRQQFVWEGMNTDTYKEVFGFYDKMGLAPGFDIYGANVSKISTLVTEYLDGRISGQGDQLTQAQLIASLVADAQLNECTTEVNAWYQAS